MLQHPTEVITDKVYWFWEANETSNNGNESNGKTKSRIKDTGASLKKDPAAHPIHVYLS
jgi:hypothetical protein